MTISETNYSMTGVPVAGCGCSACQNAAHHSPQGIDGPQALQPPGTNGPDSLESGYVWPNGGAGITLNYNFWNSMPTYYSSSADEAYGFRAFSAQMKAAAVKVLNMIESFANIDFVETTSQGQTEIGFAQAILPLDVGAWAYYPHPDPRGGDVWTNRLHVSSTDLSEGSYSFYVLLHEVGHAVGLQHTFSGGLTGEENTEQYSVMAYDTSPWGSTFAQSYQLYDIWAIQELYGANMNHNTGDDVYTLEYGRAYTIWDAGGTDTLDGSAITESIMVNLDAGTFSSVGEVNNIAIAYGATIENVIGGAGGDILYGNSAGNTIEGGSGADILYGQSGDDFLYGGIGANQLYGGSGSDTFIINADSFVGSKDTIYDFSAGAGDILKIENVLEGYSAGSSVLSDYISLSLNNKGYTRIAVDIDGAGTNYNFAKIVILQNIKLTNAQSLIDSGNLVIENGPLPVAADDSFTGTEDQNIAGNLLANNGGGVDSDPDGNSLSVRAEIVTTAQGGTAVISANGNFTYTPLANFNGNDSFDYTLLNSLGNADTGTVRLSVTPVNDAPVAQDDSFSGKVNEDITGDLLANNGSGADSDPDGDVLSVVAQTKATAQGGTVTILSDGSFTYTPTAGFTGSDSFEYTLTDSTLTDTGHVDLTVSDINRVSGAASGDTLRGTSGADEIRGLGGNDTLYGYGGDDILYGGTGANRFYGGSGADTFIIDADSFDRLKDYIYDFSAGAGDVLKIDNVLEGYDPGTSNLSDYIVISVNNKGETRVAIDIDGAGTNYNFAKIFILQNVRITDAQSLLNSGNLVIENGPLPVAQDDSFTGTEDQNITGNLLADNGNGVDSDPDGNSLSVRAETIRSAFGGTVVILASGAFTYTPAADFNGNDSFDYTLLNSLGGSDTGTVSLSVTPVNDAPVAQDDSFTGGVNENITGDLLANNGSGADTDPDGDVLSVVAEVKATIQGGTVTILSDGSFTYTPTANFTGADSFDYTLTDSTLNDTGHVDLTVTDINRITGTAGGETLNGTSNADEIKGLGGNDILYGNGGDDFLYLGADMDLLFGGSGADTFVIDNDAFIGSKDFIRDFNLGEGDAIQIENILIGYDPVTSAIEDFVLLSANSRGDTRLYVDLDGSANSHGFAKIAILQDTILSDAQSLKDNGDLIV